jgi:Phytanoyl-CoA dioxygenase (PhyH)
MSNETEFKIIPDQGELTQMERDLRFYPCMNTQPQVLTRGQIEQFNRDGYIKGIPIFDEAEAGANCRYFDALLTRVMEAGGDSYSISTAHLRYGKVYDLLTHPRIVAVVQDLLGPDVIAWGSHFFCKMPRDGKAVAWHQDASYWPLSPSRAVTIWLAIDDADRANACLRFIAGSHHFGHLTWRPSDPGEHNILNQTIENAEQYGESVDVELKAGEISVHCDLLLHGSDANLSDRRRCGLTLRYCTPSVRAGMGWNAKGVIVSGADPSGHWANPARPETD